MKSKYDHIIKIITIIISYSNSFANPLLYIFLSNKFTPFQNLKQRVDSFLEFSGIKKFFTHVCLQSFLPKNNSMNSDSDIIYQRQSIDDEMLKMEKVTSF